MRSLITQMNYDASFQLESMHMLRVTAELRRQLGRALAYSHPQLLYVVLSFFSFITRAHTHPHKLTSSQAHKHTTTQPHMRTNTHAQTHTHTSTQTRKHTNKLRRIVPAAYYRRAVQTT